MPSDDLRKIEAATTTAPGPEKVADYSIGLRTAMLQRQGSATATLDQPHTKTSGATTLFTRIVGELSHLPTGSLNAAP